MKYEELPLVNNEAIDRFELEVEGYTSFIDYKKRDNKIYLVHTEVPSELEGKGVAGSMVEKALRFIEDQQLKLVPACSYVQMYIKRHAEWERLLE